jgi:hypothetical protein
MRLYLNAKSKNKIGYTPDWLKVTYTNEKGEDIELTLDIQGFTDYHTDGLSCRTKGELLPWTTYDLETGEETDLSAIENIEEIYSVDYLLDIIEHGDNHIIGIFPADTSEEGIEAAEDVDGDDLGYGEAELIWGERTVYFKFETELNTY